MAGPEDFISGLLPSAADATYIGVQILQGILWVAVIGAIAFVMLKFKMFHKYPIKVIICQVKGGVLQQIDSDTMRRDKKKGHYDVKKRNFKWYPSSFEGQTMMPKNKSIMFVEELSHNEWRIIDPKKFIKGNPQDYKLIEKEELVREWEGVERDKADIKWKKEDKWKSIKDMALWIGLGIFMFLFWYGVGVYILQPTFQMVAGTSGTASEILNQASLILERSTEYVEMLLAQTNASYVPSWAQNESVIA